jgi:flagellar basal body-associated protein FliL
MEVDVMATEERAAAVNGERGTVLVVALFVVLLLFVLGISLLTMSLAESAISTNDVATEGALYAAEAGAQTAISQITANPANSTTAVALTTLTNGFTYRSGRKTDSSAQPITYIGASSVSGYTLANGSSYNSSGFVTHSYQINATGSGPRNSQREIEVRVEYGPVPR